MKVVIPMLAVLAAVAVAAGLAWLFLVGSSRGTGGDAVAEERALPPFTRVVIDGFADVTLVQGAAESASVEAPTKQLAGVRTAVTGDTLTISHASPRNGWLGFFVGRARGARVTVNFRQLDAIGTSGAVKVRADRLKSDRLKVSASGATSLRIDGLDTRELSVSGSGAIKVELAGRATEQRVAISGAGDYRAPELVSENARVSVSGAGRVVIQAEKTLGIALSGAGSVEYLGNPKVTQQISGAGRVKRRDAAETARIVAFAAPSSGAPPSGR